MIESGAKYGLINEANLRQAAQDALDARTNFYDYVLTPVAPITGPIALSFRHHGNLSGTVDLYGVQTTLNAQQSGTFRFQPPTRLLLKGPALTAR